MEEVKVSLDTLMLGDKDFYKHSIKDILIMLQNKMSCSNLRTLKEQILSHIQYNLAKASQNDNDSQVTVFKALHSYH